MNRLIKLLPAYYHTNQEMLDITKADLPELDQLWEQFEKLLKNQFIKTMDINRVRQWERLLRIRADPSTTTLDQRREAILLRLQMHPPVTRRWLDDFLTQRFGYENYKLDIVHNEHQMTLSIRYHDFFVLREINRLLLHLIPVTLGFDLTQTLFFKYEAVVYRAATESIFLKEVYFENFDIDRNITSFDTLTKTSIQHEHYVEQPSITSNINSYETQSKSQYMYESEVK